MSFLLVSIKKRLILTGVFRDEQQAKAFGVLKETFNEDLWGWWAKDVSADAATPV